MQDQPRVTINAIRAIDQPTVSDEATRTERVLHFPRAVDREALSTPLQALTDRDPVVTEAEKSGTIPVEA